MESEAFRVRRYERFVQSRTSPLAGSSPPVSQTVALKDLPSKYTVFSESARIPLSSSLHNKQLKLGERPTAKYISECQCISIEELSDFLLLTFGILQRKLTITWNSERRRLARHADSTYSRASASGGGLYPIDAYVVSQNCPQLPPGVYHYDVAHNELVRVRIGNFETVTRSALNLPQVDSSDFFVVLAARFWKSLFKYKNLTYQLVMQDAGTSMGSIEVVAYALGWDATILYWFQDALLCSLLGMDIRCEVPLAVLAMKTNPCKIHTSNHYRLANSENERLPFVHAQIHKRPHNCSLPPLLRQIHEEMLLDSVVRPEPPFPLRDELALAKNRSDRAVSGDLISLFCKRETSSGQFRREPPLEAEPLRQILSFMTMGVQYQTDVFGSHTGLSCVRISLILRNVKGVSDGVYSYHPSSSELSLENTRGIPSSLQSIYFLNNQNLDQVSAVLIIVGKLEAALQTFGARGVRLLNAEAGILAQRAYLASTVLSLGCAAALGFDPEQTCAITGIDGVEEIPLLLIFLGHRTSKACAYDFRLV